MAVRFPWFLEILVQSRKNIPFVPEQRIRRCHRHVEEVIHFRVIGDMMLDDNYRLTNGSIAEQGGTLDPFFICISTWMTMQCFRNVAHATPNKFSTIAAETCFQVPNILQYMQRFTIRSETTNTEQVGVVIALLSSVILRYFWFQQLIVESWQTMRLMCVFIVALEWIDGHCYTPC